MIIYSKLLPNISRLQTRRGDVLSLMWGIMCGLFLLKIGFLFLNIIRYQLRRFGPVEVVEKINSNAYRLKLPSHI